MKNKWSRFDHWVVKLAGLVLMLGSTAWIGFSIVFHYHTKATVWDTIPFVWGGIGLVFGAAILAKKTAEGGVSVILPLLDRFGKGSITTVVPAQPASVIKTTVRPLSEEEKG